MSHLATYIIIANAGSAMLWASGIHLVFGNLVIGLFEAWVARSYFKLNVRFVWIIVANYISMAFGMMIIAPWAAGLIGNPDFFAADTAFGSYPMPSFFVGMTVSYIVSVALETPFYAWVRPPYPPLGTIFRTSLLVNAMSSAAMTLFYYSLIVTGGGWLFGF